MQRVYAVERREIQRLLGDLLHEGLVSMDKPAVFLNALECYGNSTLDFVDTLLWAYQMLEGQDIFTFDSKLLKQIQRTTELIVPTLQRGNAASDAPAS